STCARKLAKCSAPWTRTSPTTAMLRRSWCGRPSPTSPRVPWMKRRPFARNRSMRRAGPVNRETAMEPPSWPVFLRAAATMSIVLAASMPSAMVVAQPADSAPVDDAPADPAQVDRVHQALRGEQAPVAVAKESDAVVAGSIRVVVRDADGGPAAGADVELGLLLSGGK